MGTPEALVADRYRRIRLLGSGGMGVVWEAWDERLERRVAIKELRLQPGLTEVEAEMATKRAMREARITARLHHRHAVPVFDVVEQDGQPCLVMQFVPSIALATALREGGSLQPREAAQVGSQVASALAAAHQAGVVHRDVKPGNILIAEDGTALISDFGISHVLGDATLTATGLVHGTPAYLAPEVAQGHEASYASDVFSLGATLYTALEGEPPFGADANSLALLHRVAAGHFPPPQHSGPLTPLLLRMLDPDPDRRPPMREVAVRLAELEGGPRTAAAAATAPIPSALAPWTRRRRKADVAPAATPAEPPAAPAGPRPAPASVLTARQTLRGGCLRMTGVLATLALLTVVVPLAMAGGGIWWLTRSADSTTTTPAGSASSAAAPSPAASSAAGSDSPSPSASRPSPSATATRTPSRSPSASPSRVDGTPTNAQLAAAITGYYRLVPGDTDAAWPLLTRSYQGTTSGGRGGYDRFWGQFRSVSAADVVGRRPDRAVATITYTYRNGATSRERTEFRLVNDDGVLKIDDTSPAG